jgi:hypothetical protein
MKQSDQLSLEIGQNIELSRGDFHQDVVLAKFCNQLW